MISCLSAVRLGKIGKGNDLLSTFMMLQYLWMSVNRKGLMPRFRALKSVENCVLYLWKCMHQSLLNFHTHRDLIQKCHAMLIGWWLQFTKQLDYLMGTRLCQRDRYPGPWRILGPSALELPTLRHCPSEGRKHFSMQRQQHRACRAMQEQQSLSLQQKSCGC